MSEIARLLFTSTGLVLLMHSLSTMFDDRVVYPGLLFQGWIICAVVYALWHNKKDNADDE